MFNQNQHDSGIYVKPVWDEDAGVFRSESNIGLQIEAETEEEFYALAHELAPDLSIENHIMFDEQHAEDEREVDQVLNSAMHFSEGVMYLTGQGVAKDYAEAAQWYRMAAEQGHAAARLYLGNLGIL